MAQNVEKRAVGAQRLRPCGFRLHPERNLSFRTQALRPYKYAENHFVHLRHNAKVWQMVGWKAHPTGAFGILQKIGQN